MKSEVEEEAWNILPATHVELRKESSQHRALNIPIALKRLDTLPIKLVWPWKMCSVMRHGLNENSKGSRCSGKR